MLLTRTNVSHLFATTRPPFLILTPVCIFLGVSTASDLSAIDYSRVIWILCGALLAHISVNSFNEYLDDKSGLDAMTNRTPFSGGSGTLQKFPELASATLFLAVVSCLFAMGIGGYLIWLTNWQLAIVGVLGVLIIILYTPIITRSPLLCLLMPGLAFGPLMVMGTSFVLNESYSLFAFTVSLVPFFLVNNLLLLNQFPDIQADRAVGRSTYPLLIGAKKSSVIFTVFYALAYLVILIGVISGLFNVLSLIALVTLFLAVPMISGVRKNADDVVQLMPFLKHNVLLNLLTPTLFGIGLWLS